VRKAVALAAVLLACEGGPPRAPGSTKLAAVPDPPCAVARARTRAAASAAKLGADEPTVIAQFDRCWQGWAVALDVLCREVGLTFDNTDTRVTVLGRWVVVYTAPDGSSATYTRHSYSAAHSCITSDKPGNIAEADLSTLTHIEPPKLFDYDGDGHPEILMNSTHSYIQDHPEIEGESLNAMSQSELLTFKHKVISPYPLRAGNRISTSEIVDLKDVDGDGRPELWMSFNVAVPRSVPKRIAHSLPDGTFSFDDEVAKQAVIDQCPKATALLVVRADQSIDTEASLAAIGCAALRGEPGRDVRKRVEAECAKRRVDCLDYARWANDMYLYSVGTQ
jgi:hypothetical protein